MDINRIIEKLNIDPKDYKDLHITRFFSSFVAVSHRKVIKISDPVLKYCPLAKMLYKDLPDPDTENIDFDKVKSEIKKSVMEKIEKFGHFTENRKLKRSDIAVPYGTSEMLMIAREKEIIDSAVLVCDGAGTVITDSSETAQGIGSRMNGLFYTTRIKKVISRLEKEGAHLLSENASIDQFKGVKKAIKLGYKNIAVTVNGFLESNIAKYRELEKDQNVNIYVIVLCTTGVTEKRVKEIGKYADMVWSCGSDLIRKETGSKAIVQLTNAIPVFIMTGKGIEILDGYVSEDNITKFINLKKQYLINTVPVGRKLKMGNNKVYIKEKKLPVRSKREPK
ncbi:MAG: DUF2099 family protein [Elusimicrobiota bacterium]